MLKCLYSSSRLEGRFISQDIRSSDFDGDAGVADGRYTISWPFEHRTCSLSKTGDGEERLS